MPSQLHSVFLTIFLGMGNDLSRYPFFGITRPAVQNGTLFSLDQERFFAFALGLKSYTYCLLVRICVLLPVIVRPIIFYLHLGRGFLTPATKENNEALETIYRRKSWMVMKARNLSYPYWVPRGRLAGEHGPKDCNTSEIGVGDERGCLPRKEPEVEHGLKSLVHLLNA